MRRFVLMILLVLPFAATAQVNFATTANLNENIKKLSMKAGQQLIHNEPGKFRIYAIFNRHQLSELYAMNTKGQRLTPFYTKVKNGCEVCFRAGNGKLYCYDLMCAYIPQKESTTNRTPLARPITKHDPS